MPLEAAAASSLPERSVFGALAQTSPHKPPHAGGLKGNLPPGGIPGPLHEQLQAGTGCRAPGRAAACREGTGVALHGRRSCYVRPVGWKAAQHRPHMDKSPACAGWPTLAAAAPLQYIINLGF